MYRSVNSGIVIVIILVCVLFSGCGGGDATTSTGNRRFGSLEFALTTTKANYARGEQVPLAFTVKNIGSQTVDVIQGACNVFDTKVTRSGQAVWQESVNLGCIANVRFISIAPGETKSYDSAWPQIDQQGNAVSPGQYTLTSWYQPYSVTDTNLSAGNQEVNEVANPIQIVVQ